MAIDGSSHFVPVPKWGNNETTRAKDRPGSKLWPSTGAATSCLSLSGVIMRLPGRGIALVVGYGHRRGEELRPVPHLYDNATAVDGSSHFVPVPHLYDNATAVDGSSCFAPVPHLGNNETTRARDRPGSRLWLRSTLRKPL